MFLKGTVASSQWNLITPAVVQINYSLMDIYFINKDTGFVVGSVNSESAILRTKDGGINWDTTTYVDVLNAPDWIGFKSISFVNDTLGYVSCNGDVVKTVDCGETWFSLDTADLWGFTTKWYNVMFVNKDTGYIAYQDGGAQCLRTLDGGWTWQPDPVLNGVRNFNSFNGIYTGCTGGWALLDLATLTWTHSFSNQFGGELGLNFYDAVYHNGKIIVVGDSYLPSAALYATSSDLGQTWVLKRLDVFGIEDIQFVNDTVAYASGGVQGTIKTTDGGETWSLMQIDDYGTGMYKNFEKFHMVNDTLGYGISLSSIYKTTNAGGSPILEIPVIETYQTGLSELATTFKIYPNPTSDLLYISNQTDESFSFKIYSIDGKLLMTENEIVGQFQINLENFEAGNYFVKIQSQSDSFFYTVIKK